MKIPRLITIETLEGLTLNLQFEDGTTGTLDFTQKSKIGVLNKLQNLGFFSSAELNNGIVQWPDEIEIDGDSLYLELKSMTFEEWKEKQLINA